MGLAVISLFSLTGLQPGEQCLQKFANRFNGLLAFNVPSGSRKSWNRWFRRSPDLVTGLKPGENEMLRAKCSAIHSHGVCPMITAFRTCFGSANAIKASFSHRSTQNFWSTN